MKTFIEIKAAIKTGLTVAVVAMATNDAFAAWERSAIADSIPEYQRVLAPSSGDPMPMMITPMSGGFKISLSDPKLFFDVKGGPSTSGASAELKSMAAALDHSAGRIIDWVTRYIDFEPYNGMKRGAKLTALERAGNSFDQAALAVELLRASGFDASYVFVNMEIPVGDACNWLGVAPDSLWSYLVNSQMDYVNRLSAPVAGQPLIQYTDSTMTMIQVPQVWVKLVVGGQALYFDPSYKLYEYATPASWKTMSGYSGTSIYGEAGGTESTETVGNNGAVVSKFVGNKNGKNNMRSLLSRYATSLVTALRKDGTQYSRSGREVMGGRWLDFSSAFAGAEAEPLEFWDNDIPEDYKTRLHVQVGNINHAFFLADIDGGKISIGFNGSNAILYLNDVQVAAETNGLGVNAAVMLTYRYMVDGSHPDGLHKQSCAAAPISRQGHYVINHGSAYVTGRVKERIRVLSNLLNDGCAGDSREVVTENLYIMGLSYLNEVNNINEVASAALPVRIAMLHHAGVVGLTNAPFVDLPLGLISIGIRDIDPGTPLAEVENMRNNAFMACTYWGSMLEHSIIEQMLITDASSTNPNLNKGVSTTKFIQNYVENGHTIYAAMTREQWIGLKSSANVLKNYEYAPGVLAAGDAVFTSNANKGLVLLPKDYSQSHYDYKGMGYINLSFQASYLESIMGITGVLGLLKGGSFAENTLFEHSIVITNNTLTLGIDAYPWSNPLGLSSSASPVDKIFSLDPVDLSSGAFYLSATDLTVGNGSAPYGLAFTRVYSTSMRNGDTTGLGRGWTHNYDMRIAYQHAGDVDLNRATPEDVVPILLAVSAIYDICNSDSSPTAKRYVVPALVACWLGDQFINSRAVVQTADRSLTFAKLPDGTFVPPAGVAATLTKSGTTHTMKMRKGLEYVFDAEGRISSITDRNTDKQTARSLTMTYNKTSGKLELVKDAYTRTLTLAYSGDKLVKVTDNSSTSRFTSYNDTGIAFEYTDPEKKVTTYYKDAKHRITSIKDALGRTTIANTYDDYDRVVLQHSMGDPSKEWRYDYAPGATRECDPKGGVSLYSFDTKGRHVSQYDQLGNRTQFKYDGVDRLVEKITPVRAITYHSKDTGQTPEQEITYYDYDKNHELVAVTDPAGRITTSEPSDDTSTSPRYDTSPGGLAVRTNYHKNIHLPSAITKLPGNITETYVYDSYGRLTQHHPAAYETDKYVLYSYTPATGVPTQMVATYPNGKETTKFDAIGNVIETTTRDGIRTTYTYNKRRQITKSIVWDGATAAQTSQVFYDDVGNVLYTEDPRGNWVDYTYNADGKLESMTDPLGNTRMNIYDLCNLLSATIDPLAFKTNYDYDPAQRLTAVTNALGHTTKMTYDSLGLKVTATTALGHTVRTEYDDARLLQTKATDDIGRDIIFTYDADGRQITMTNRREQVYTTAYNDALRTITTTTPADKETIVSSNTRGLVDTIVRPSDRIVKNTTFDSEGRVLTQVIYDTDEVSVLASSTMTYSGTSGRLLSVSENGKTSARTYDTLGRLASYSDGEGNTIAYGYDCANNLTTLVYPGNKVITYQYDANNRLSAMQDWDSKMTIYAYDVAGRLTETTRLRPGGAVGTIRKQVYDAIGQIRYIEERNASDTLLWMRAFEYDADGRITKTFTWPAQIPATTAAANAGDTADYDGDNRIGEWNIPGIGSISCIFDDDGNLLTGPDATGTGTAIYHYDAHNRLTGVNNQTLYRYNPDGNRVEAAGIKYLVDPNAALSRILWRVDGSTTTYYIWGANGLEYEINGSTTKTYHADHLGSTMLLTDDNGNPTGEYFEYDSYGTPTYTAGNPTTPFRWHGVLGVTTEANGLIHMRARFYNPRIMRFLNQDPIGFAGGMNWFAFVENNPIGNVDPEGLYSFGPGYGALSWRANGSAASADSHHVAQVTSVGVGFIPIVGSIQSGVELISGRDYITGESASRTWAGVGLAAGLLPFGKGATKIGSKIFSAGVRTMDDAIALAPRVAQRGKGVLYLREAANSYVGQSIDFAARQATHDRLLGVAHDFSVLGTYKPGLSLNVMEESAILAYGGTRRTGGFLSNMNHAPGMAGGSNFIPSVNSLLGDYQFGMLMQSGLLNGAAGIPPIFSGGNSSSGCKK